MHRLTSSLALLLCVSATAWPRPAAGFTWEACDADAAPFKSTQVLLTPDPPRIGSQVTFTIKGTAGVYVGC
jgi:hypothetical protein